MNYIGAVVATLYVALGVNDKVDKVWGYDIFANQEGGWVIPVIVQEKTT